MKLIPSQSLERALRSIKGSVLFALSCVLSACTPALSPEIVGLRAASQIDQITSTYGTVEDPILRRELDEIGGRVARAIPSDQRLALEVLLVGAHEPFAYAPGGGFILLSLGLVQRAETEAALAFVIAHEASHDVLGHTQQQTEEAPELRRQQELAADRYALGLVAAAGYDPRIAIQAITHLYGAEERFRPERHYPSMVDRLRVLQTALAHSGWEPPGTVTRRSYMQFQQRLSALGFHSSAASSVALP